jgi:hypothetical protein
MVKKFRLPQLGRNHSPVRYAVDHARDMVDDPEALSPQFLYDTVYSLKATPYNDEHLISVVKK